MAANLPDLDLVESISGLHLEINSVIFNLSNPIKFLPDPIVVIYYSWSSVLALALLKSFSLDVVIYFLFLILILY